eukprot:590642-Pyramimonas_sp.AAC.1
MRVPAPPGLWHPSPGRSEARRRADRRLRLHMARTVHYGMLENVEESVEENEGSFEDVGGTKWQESEDEEQEMIEEAAKATHNGLDANQLSEKDAFGGAQKELEGINIDVNGLLHESAQDKYGVEPNQITIPNERRPGDAIPDGDAVPDTGAVLARCSDLGGAVRAHVRGAGP